MGRERKNVVVTVFSRAERGKTRSASCNISLISFCTSLLLYIRLFWHTCRTSVSRSWGCAGSLSRSARAEMECMNFSYILFLSAKFVHSVFLARAFTKFSVSRSWGCAGADNSSLQHKLQYTLQHSGAAHLRANRTSQYWIPHQLSVHTPISLGCHCALHIWEQIELPSIGSPPP